MELLVYLVICLRDDNCILFAQLSKKWNSKDADRP